MGHAEALGAGQPVHNPDDVVIGCRGIPFIVGAEGSTLHPIPVLDDMLRAAIALGQPSHAVTSARNEPVAVRAPGQDGVGAARVQRPVIEEVAARLPEADLSVQHGKGQDVAIGREAECAHAIGLLHIDRFHILFIEIIQGQEAVCPANGQHAVADVQVENRARECKLLDQVPACCIPDLDRPVGAGGDQIAAILREQGIGHIVFMLFAEQHLAIACLVDTGLVPGLLIGRIVAVARDESLAVRGPLDVPDSPILFHVSDRFCQQAQVAADQTLRIGGCDPHIGVDGQQSAGIQLSGLRLQVLRLGDASLGLGLETLFVGFLLVFTRDLLICPRDLFIGLGDLGVLLGKLGIGHCDGLGFACLSLGPGGIVAGDPGENAQHDTDHQGQGYAGQQCPLAAVRILAAGIDVLRLDRDDLAVFMAGCLCRPALGLLELRAIQEEAVIAVLLCPFVGLL